MKIVKQYGINWSRQWWWWSEAKLAIVNTCFFSLLRTILVTHFEGSRKLIFGMPPYFDPTRRNIFVKNLAKFFWPSFGCGRLEYFDLKFIFEKSELSNITYNDYFCEYSI